MIPIVISSSPEPTPSHETTYAMSMVILTSDDDTLPPSKPRSLFPAQIVEIVSSDDSIDDLTIHKIQRNRAERAAILKIPQDEIAETVFGDLEKRIVQDDTIDAIEWSISAKTDPKKLEKQRLKQAKEAQKETQRNVKKVNYKRDKNATAKEMIVELSRDLMDRNGEELVSLLQEIDVECVYSANPFPNTLLFKRKVISKS